MKVCGGPLGHWADGGYADGLLHIRWLGLVLWGVYPILRNGCGHLWTKLCSTVPGK